MLSQSEIREVAAIDQQNMAGMLRQRGELYAHDKRADEVMREIDMGVQYLTIRRDGKMVAYISYKISGTNLWIKSIQLAPGISRFLVKVLIQEVSNKTQAYTYSHVRSKVFTNNGPSQRLHEKLGFKPE